MIAWRDPRLAWCLYDFGASAFSTLIATFVFSVYLTRQVAPDPDSGATGWSVMLALVGIVLAFFAVPLGRRIDRQGGTIWLRGGMALCILATAALWFIKPIPDAWLWGLVLVAIAMIGNEVAGIAYGAQLPALAGPQQVGRLSGWAWGMGYLGGLLCLGLALWLVKMPPDWLQADSGAVRATALLAALWILVFTWPLLRVRLPQTPVERHDWRTMLRQIGAQPGLWRLLLATALYRDGLNILFQFGGIYAAARHGFDFTQLILFAISLNLVAGLGAVLFSLLDDRRGPHIVVPLSLLALCGLGLVVLWAPDANSFWLATLALCVFTGPAQAAGRSWLARYCRADNRGQLFGWYALTGRMVSFIGPALYGLLLQASGSQQWAMASALILWLAGLVLLPRRPPSAT